MVATSLEELKEIINRDYNKLISDDQAKQLGMSLLRLTRIGITALARVDEKNSSTQAREENFLESKTST